jgi:hypothetical protein
MIVLRQRSDLGVAGWHYPADRPAIARRMLIASVGAVVKRRKQTRMPQFRSSGSRNEMVSHAQPFVCAHVTLHTRVHDPKPPAHNPTDPSRPFSKAELRGCAHVIV